jgi:hypothetical protein
MSIVSATIQLYLAYGVVAIMVVGTLVNLLGPAGIKAAYTRWGFPTYFRFVTAGLEGLAALLILMEPAREAGLLLAAAIMVAAVATLVRCREASHTPPALIVLTAALLALV